MIFLFTIINLIIIGTLEIMIIYRRVKYVAYYLYKESHEVS